MNTSGFGEGEIAMKGSVNTGFKLFKVSKEFGASLEEVEPQPSGCAF